MHDMTCVVVLLSWSLLYAYTTDVCCFLLHWSCVAHALWSCTLSVAIITIFLLGCWDRVYMCVLCYLSRALLQVVVEWYMRHMPFPLHFYQQKLAKVFYSAKCRIVYLCRGVLSVEIWLVFINHLWAGHYPFIQGKMANMQYCFLFKVHELHW